MIKNTRGSCNSPFFYCYCITDPVEFGNSVDELQDSLNKAIKNHHIDMVCFRDKVSKDIEPLARLTLSILQKNNIKAIINSRLDLAVQLGFDGVHLTSNQFDRIKIAKSHNLFTIISCHTTDEIKHARELGADAVTYSPIFYKQNKGEPKGIEKLQKAVELYQEDSFKVIALGGIVTQEHLNKVKSTKAYGFASIRYFTK